MNEQTLLKQIITGALLGLSIFVFKAVTEPEPVFNIYIEAGKLLGSLTAAIVMYMIGYRIWLKFKK
jgi:hypothetical protein